MTVVVGLCALSTAMLVGPAARPVALRARATRRACPAIFMAEPAPKPLKMSEKLALVAEELGLELDGLKVATAVAAGNKAVGIEGEGPLGAQMQRLLKELGIGKAREEEEAKAEEEAVVAEEEAQEEGAENEAAKQANEEAVEAADDEVVVVAEENVQKGRKALLLDDVGPLLDARQELLQALGALDAKGKAPEKAPEKATEQRAMSAQQVWSTVVVPALQPEQAPQQSPLARVATWRCCLGVPSWSSPRSRSCPPRQLAAPLRGSLKRPALTPCSAP